MLFPGRALIERLPLSHINYHTTSLNCFQKSPSILSTLVTYALLDHTGVKFRLRQMLSFEGSGLIHIIWEAFLVLVIDLSYNHHTHYF